MRMKTVLTSICTMLCIAGLATRAVATEPVVYYSFDSLGTEVTDESGNGYTGTVNGGVDIVADAFSGNSFLFNGADSYIQLDRPIQDDFTICAWIKTSTTGSTGSYAYQGSGLVWSDVAGTANDFVMAVLGTKLSFFGGNPDVSVSSTATVVTGDWVFVTAIRNKSAQTLSVYVNGVFDSKVAHANTSALDGNSSLVIGANTLDSHYYAGQIDEVKLFDAVLTDTEISGMFSVPPSWYKAKNPTPTDGKVGVTMALLQWAKGEGAATHTVYLGTSPDLTEADRVASGVTSLFYYHAAGLTAGTTYYWRVDEVEKDGMTIHTGDVWTFLTQAETAYYPTPTDGANSAQLTQELTWATGKSATGHHVYFGADADAVAAGSADVDQGALAVDVTTFSPGTLDALTDYYWRVDETRIGNVVMAGPVWSFSTVLPVEDFESYTDDEGSRIYEFWIDGYTNGTGMTVGNWDAPFAELTIVHDVNQAMPLDYNNVDEPYYSEAQYEFDSTQDWTVDDAGTLILYVRGRADNAQAPLYFGLEDSSSKTTIVTYPDETIATSTKWVEWQIPLSDFTNVNLTRIKMMYIGMGDSENPTEGGLGRMYIDTICLGK